MAETIINEFRTELVSRLKFKTTYSRKELISLSHDIYSNVGVDITDTKSKILYDIVTKFNREISKNFFLGRNQARDLFDRCMLSIMNDGFAKKNKNDKITAALDRIKQRKNL